ncbi:MAG: hypothetical protein SO016_11550 [Lachnospiraceae bacterium]|nr:hypothetical protein [Robinsoniella sp.]MDY3767300.1 hypothetical protein [Lachnospiraceae bacterium]
MKKTIGRYLAVIVLGAVMLMGCEGREKESGKVVYEVQKLEKRQEEMEEYLRQKYGDISYEVMGVVWKFWNQVYDQMNFQVEREGRKETCWVRRYEKEGRAWFMDSYFGLCIREEYEKKMEQTAKIFFPEAKVISFMQETGFSETVRIGDGLEDARKKGEEIRVISWLFVAEVTEEELENRTVQFCDAWQKEKMESLISIFLIEKDMFVGLDRDRAEEIVREKKYQAQCVCHAKPAIS